MAHTNDLAGYLGGEISSDALALPPAGAEIEDAPSLPPDLDLEPDTVSLDEVQDILARITRPAPAVEPPIDTTPGRSPSLTPSPGGRLRRGLLLAACVLLVVSGVFLLRPPADDLPPAPAPAALGPDHVDLAKQDMLRKVRLSESKALPLSQHGG